MKTYKQIAMQAARLIDLNGLTPENRWKSPTKERRAKLIIAIKDRYSRNIAAALGLTWSTPMNQACDMMNTAVEREIYAK